MTPLPELKLEVNKISSVNTQVINKLDLNVSINFKYLFVTTHIRYFGTSLEGTLKYDYIKKLIKVIKLTGHKVPDYLLVVSNEFYVKIFLNIKKFKKEKCNLFNNK